jgi:hypothetical protein
MREKQSQFNHICTFVNSTRIGSTFTTKEYLKAIGHTENSTWWKRNSGNRHYICHQYKGYLGRAGFIKNLSYGVWIVEKHIPSWFTLGHLQHLLGYQYKGEIYKGMTQNDIREKLNASTVHVITKKVDTISNNSSPSNDIPGSSQKSVNNIGEKIVTNSTYGYKTENHPIMKAATVEKIDHTDSEFFNEPTLSTGDQKIDLAVNIGVLESAKAVLSQFTSNDTFERARVYNVMAQIEHISKELQEKINLI